MVDKKTEDPSNEESSVFHPDHFSSTFHFKPPDSLALFLPTPIAIIIVFLDALGIWDWIGF